MESYISYSDAYPFPIIKIKGSKNKDKKPEKIEDNIFNSREYGQYSLDITFKEDNYSLTNEEPEIEEPDADTVDNGGSKYDVRVADRMW